MKIESKTMNSERCDIIIPVWNQLAVTRDCIDGIARSTGYPYRLILIDNGSDRQTKEYLEGVRNSRAADVKLIRNEKNLGFVKAVNQGMRLSDARYICIMNNDTIPAKGWLDNMVEFAKAHPDAGLMNPASDGNPAIPAERHAEAAAMKKGQYMEVNQCFFFATLIKKEVIDKIGYLDENFDMGCYDDADYARRAAGAGYRCVRVESAYVHHLHGVSFKAYGNHSLLTAKGEEKFFKKWPVVLRIGVAFMMDDAATDQEIANLLNGLLCMAREWCWISLWVFGSLDKNNERIRRVIKERGLPLHQNINFIYLPRRLARAQILIRVLERCLGTKRRKKYGVILTNDKRILAFLKSLYLLHEAKVYCFDMTEDIKPGILSIISESRKNRCAEK